MTQIIRQTDIAITSDFQMTGIYGRTYFPNVDSYQIDRGQLSFEYKLQKETLYMETNRPFTVLTRKSLSCGHKIESYKCDLYNGRPENERCSECEPPANIKYVESVGAIS